jgi:ABC-type transport system substrate-binding protein
MGKIAFGLRPGSPFLDERVRRAVSMLIDRNAWIEVFSDTKRFADAGWPVEARWTGLGARAHQDWWVDPQGGDLGEGAAYFKFDPEGAAQQLSAAGFDDAIETNLTYFTTLEYGASYPRMGEVLKGMLEATGKFKFNTNIIDYRTEFVPKYEFGKGDFEGILHAAATGGSLHRWWHSDGLRQNVAFQGDPTSVSGQVESDALIEQIDSTIDRAERFDLLRRWQRENAVRMPMIPWAGGIPSFYLAWPWAGNTGVYLGHVRESRLRNWFDESKYTG